MARRKKQEESVQEPEQVQEPVAAVYASFETQEEQARDREAERPPAQQAQTVILLDPYEIQALQEFNMRRFQTPRESIISLAMSMLDDGQQEPVKVEEHPDGSYHLIFGYRRWQAAVMLNEEKLSEQPFKLQAVVVQQSDHTLDDWIVAGVVENTQRVGLGPLDEAYAISKMKDTGMNQSTIAKRMGVSAATITQRLKLLDLPAMAQKRVNRGETPIDLALVALDLPEGEERTEALKSLTEKQEGVGRRKKASDDGEEPEVVEGDSGKVLKLVRPKTAKKMLAELEGYATPNDDGERTKAQVWLLTKLIPWVRNPNRKFQKVMEALEGLS